MSKYLRKPETVDAFFWTGDIDQTEYEYPEWVISAIADEELVIRMREGVLFMDVSNWEGNGNETHRAPCWVVYSCGGYFRLYGDDTFNLLFDKIPE